MDNTQGATSGHGNGVVYGVVALAGGVPVRVTVAFPAPLDADVWARASNAAGTATTSRRWASSTASGRRRRKARPTTRPVPARGAARLWPARVRGRASTTSRRGPPVGDASDTTEVLEHGIAVTTRSAGGVVGEVELRIPRGVPHSAFASALLSAPVESTFFDGYQLEGDDGRDLLVVEFRTGAPPAAGTA